MKVSAGILLFRRRSGGVEALLVHPGGPFFRKRKEGVWSIPKGLVEEGEDRLEAARREFREETGFRAGGEALPLGSVRQKGGKEVHAWAVEGDCDPASLQSGTFRMEWPPRSGREAEFPEVDEACFAGPGEARRLILPAQRPFLERLEARLREETEEG